MLDDAISRDARRPKRIGTSVLHLEGHVVEFFWSAAEAIVKRFQNLNIIDRLSRGMWIVPRSGNRSRKDIDARRRE